MEHRSNYTYSNDGLVVLPASPLSANKLDLPYYRFIKRFVDVVLGGLLALFTLPWLIPLVAIIIKSESKGPVFFTQKRTGKNRKSFYCIKFRSMVVNDQANRIQVQRGDQRITRTGHFLRKYYIDELPQLINVIKGDMSLVGPRPHMLRHNVRFAWQVRDYHDRHKVKPGLTGLAQMRGYHGMINNNDDLYNRINADLEYIKNWTPASDFNIFILTINHVLQSLSSEK